MSDVLPDNEDVNKFASSNIGLAFETEVVGAGDEDMEEIFLSIDSFFVSSITCC